MPPKAVEIINPEGCPVLFHKHTVPLIQGDESQTPISSFDYKNMILEYEINGHVYIFSSDGVASRIDGKIDGNAKITLSTEEVQKLAEAITGGTEVTLSVTIKN